MKQYIDKDAVVAEIEKYIANYKAILNKVDKSSDDWVESTVSLESKIEVLQHVLYFLAPLETKEVNLDGEINLWVRNLHRVPNFEELNKFAKHFFELGMTVSNKAQKGE